MYVVHTSFLPPLYILHGACGGAVGNVPLWLRADDLVGYVGATVLFNSTLGRYETPTDASNPFVTGNNISGPDWMSAITTLPVQLTNFNATRNGNAANLSWPTASEVNFSHFEVGARTSNNIWVKIATIAGNATNTTVVSNYTLADVTALAKAVKQVTD